MASKRDYNTISEALRITNPMFARCSTTARTERMVQWREDVTALAAVLKALNAHFNVELFFQNTGLAVKEKGGMMAPRDRRTHH
jgi:hypothetical protein